MQKYLLIFAICLFSSAYSLEATHVDSGSIVNTWTWEKSLGGSDNPYTSTPKTIGFSKKIIFTSNGKVITYKNDVEIRNSTYVVEKGTGYFDHAEHDLVTFEGKTYVIEKLDNQNLTLVSNNSDGARTIYKR